VIRFANVFPHCDGAVVLQDKGIVFTAVRETASAGADDEGRAYGTRTTCPIVATLAERKARASPANDETPEEKRFAAYRFPLLISAVNPRKAYSEPEGTDSASSSRLVRKFYRKGLKNNM
jgi:hypothetical protein